jgi:hypothetical protein
MAVVTISLRDSPQGVPDLSDPAVLEQAREEARERLRRQDKRRLNRRRLLFQNR